MMNGGEHSWNDIVERSDDRMLRDVLVSGSVSLGDGGNEFEIGK